MELFPTIFSRSGFFNNSNDAAFHATSKHFDFEGTYNLSLFSTYSGKSVVSAENHFSLTVGGRQGRYLPPPSQQSINGGNDKYHDKNNKTIEDDIPSGFYEVDHAFLSRLVALNLPFNSISRLDRKVLRQMKNLKMLNLTLNNLHFLAEDAFEENQQLMEVSLRVSD